MSTFCVSMCSHTTSVPNFGTMSPSRVSIPYPTMQHSHRSIPWMGSTTVSTSSTTLLSMGSL